MPHGVWSLPSGDGIRLKADPTWSVESAFRRIGGISGENDERAGRGTTESTPWFRRLAQSKYAGARALHPQLLSPGRTAARVPSRTPAAGAGGARNLLSIDLDGRRRRFGAARAHGRSRVRVPAGGTRAGRAAARR